LIDFLKVDPEKITVIHLGFSLTGNKSNIEFSTRRPYILFVGNRGGYKNFETLLQVYAQCTFLNSKYDLIAFGGGCLSSTERIRIETLGLSVDQVRDIQGGDELLAAAYKKAALFVFPSFYEGFGIPPLEAMGFRCPVACSNQSSMPEVVGDAAILFDPYSIDSMREALELILSNDALRAEYVSKGIERIRNFSWDKCAAETMAVYEKVLK
jgi:glycosyltransferase involved in cell wall biosynthesis